MTRAFPRSSKSQADEIQLLLEHGWKEDQARDIAKSARNDLYLWRWRQPGTGALFTLHDAVAVIEGQKITRVITKRH
jgi:hypothetical protein